MSPASVLIGSPNRLKEQAMNNVHYTTVSEIPEHWALVQQEQEVASFNETIAKDVFYGCWYIEAMDGEIVNAYGCYRTVPDLDALVVAEIVDGVAVNEDAEDDS
jgi:hypothetical protein